MYKSMEHQWNIEFSKNQTDDIKAVAPMSKKNLMTIYCL